MDRTPGTKLTHVGLAELPEKHPVGVFHAFWRSVTDESRQVAPWASFDPADHPRILPWILLLKHEGVTSADDPIWRYSVCGTGCSDLFGFSYQGKVFGENLPPDAIAQRRAEFDRVCNGSGPLFSQSDLPIHGRSSIEICRGVFPFSDGGQVVDRIVVILAESNLEIL